MKNDEKRATPQRFALLGLLLLSSLSAFVCAAPETPPLPSPLFLGTSLPEPPQQNAPWTPPTDGSLPPAFVSAAKTLFEQGLADPRGCDYREISVGTGNVWSADGGVQKTHGWVLPAHAGDTQPFAVCWNGLVYPVVAVGPKADLAADTQALLKGSEPSTFFSMAAAEGSSISETSLTPLKACLLLRLGETGAARKMSAVQKAKSEEKDPYLDMASDWTWGLFDRAVTAHMRGDDELSVLSARRLTVLQPRIEAEAARRGFVRPPYYDSGPHTQPHPYLDFLDILPDLLTDEEGRVSAPKRTPALQIGLDNFPTKAARIDALIADLNQVSARQWSQPGGVNLAEDPIVQALVGEGDAAVEPLIHDLATDTRLTRSIGFGRSFFRYRYTSSAAGAAFSALCGILHTSEFGQPPHQDVPHAALAVFVQTYWNRNKGTPLAERWYRTLADDAATPEQWLAAASEIVRPGDEVSQGSWVVTKTRLRGHVPPMQGESLRRGHSPTVSALMAKRVPQIAVSGDQRSSMALFIMRDAAAMALHLSEWDPVAAVPVLKAQIKRADALLAQWQGNQADYFSLDRAKMTQARVRGHDPTALGEYLKWLNGVPLTQLPSFDISTIFEPLWSSPRDPGVITGSASLFTTGVGSGLYDLLESPLLGLETFRHAYLTRLGDSAVVGKLKVDDKGQLTVEGPLSGYGMDDYSDPLRPQTAQTIPVRRCDVYAWHLSRLDGLPHFELFWPQARRDATIMQAVRVLRRYGPRFQWRADLAYLWNDFPNPRAHLTFPKLDHPGTPAEVQSARAIFSLAGQGAVVRLWPMPEWPMKAKWIGDKRYAREVHYSDGSLHTAYWQDGVVYQAEEREKNGQWQRFFGFVGPHDIARVPASEIEFLPDNEYSWMRLSGPLDCRALLPESAASRRVGDPLPITLSLRNRTGLDQRVPTDILRRDASGLPALRRGISLKLSYSPPLVGLKSYLMESTRIWTDLTPTRTAAFAPTAAARNLTPAQEMTALQLDLRDWADLHRPGSYRLQFVFDGTVPGLGSGQSNPITFDLGPADALVQAGADGNYRKFSLIFERYITNLHPALVVYCGNLSCLAALCMLPARPTKFCPRASPSAAFNTHGVSR